MIKNNLILPIIITALLQLNIFPQGINSQNLSPKTTVSDIYVSYAEPGYHLAAEMLKQLQSGKHEIDIYEIMHSWANGSKESKKNASILFDYYRLRDYFMDNMNSIYLYFELENGHNFALKITDPSGSYDNTKIQFLSQKGIS